MVGDSRWTKTQVKALSKAAGEFYEIAKIIRKEAKTKALFEIQEYVEEAYPHLVKAWDILKNLIVESGRPNASMVVDKIVRDVSPVEIGFNEKGWFRLKMGSLPAKEIAANANYIRDVLYAHLADYHKKVGIHRRFHQCVIIFNHIYRFDVPEKQYRDYDNIELNMVIDAIALYVMEDDGAGRCQHFYYSSPGEENATEVYVVPTEEFLDFLQMAKRKEGR